MKFTKNDIGCYADGAHGSRHIRQKLIDLLKHCIHPATEEVIEALKKQPSDDMWEELEAMEYLDDICDEDVTFVMYNGDLMLVDLNQFAEIVNEFERKKANNT